VNSVIPCTDIESSQIGTDALSLFGYCVKDQFYLNRENYLISEQKETSPVSFANKIDHHAFLLG
jgi:hypothetical protein